MLTKKLLLFAGAFALAISCKNSNIKNDSGFDSELETARKGIDASNQEWLTALKKGDSIALADLYTKDGEIITPGDPIRQGREEITKDMGEIVRYGVTDVTDTVVGFWGENHVYTAEYIETFFDSTGKILAHGKSLCVWKEVEGKWKLFRDMFVPEKRQD
ncbi:MAG TPA: nuclear transport factor 2 family protein [Puia sp.]|nr:nuclear transport factor 2 family protein [Puia sp.]